MQPILEEVSSKQTKSESFGNMLKRINYLSGKFVWLEHDVYLSPWVNVMCLLQLLSTNLLFVQRFPLETVFITCSLVPLSFYYLIHNLQLRR